MHIHVRINLPVRPSMHIYVRIDSKQCAYTYMYTHKATAFLQTRTYIHTYIHTHTKKKKRETHKQKKRKRKGSGRNSYLTVCPSGANLSIWAKASFPQGASLAEKSYMRGPLVTFRVWPSTRRTEADVPLTEMLPISLHICVCIR